MTASPGFQAPRLPRPLAALNGAWKAVGRAGLAQPSLTEASLIAAARRSAGLDDLGADFAAPATREALRRLLWSLENEAELHPLGRAILRSSLVRTLVNRLRLEQVENLHPEIEAISVTAPVFIVGLPRTGTTLLHRLLSCDPKLRPLISWEATNPLPFPGPARSDGRDPRMRLAERAERGLRYVAPEFFAIHPVEAHAPEEDVLILDGSFMSPTVDATLPVPEYSEWIAALDQRYAYRYFRRMLKILSWQRRGRYLGKTPHHLENLDALVDVFPDAKIIQTHRDPLQVVASFCSMMAHARGIFSDKVDPRAVGAQLSAKSVRGVTRSIESRERLGPERFRDVAYTDLVADPMKEIRRIYDFIGEELVAETERTMQAWRQQNAQNRHGVHRYRLVDFGLERDRLAAQFSPYCSRFAVETAR